MILISGYFAPSRGRVFISSLYLVMGLALILCSSCATAPLPTVTYPGPELPVEKTAILFVPDIVYSVDGATRDPAGNSYFGYRMRLSLLPGEHEIVLVVREGQRYGGWTYVGKKKLWYKVKATLAAGNSYYFLSGFELGDPTYRLFFIESNERDLKAIYFKIISQQTGKCIAKGQEFEGTIF